MFIKNMLSNLKKPLPTEDIFAKSTGTTKKILNEGSVEKGKKPDNPRKLRVFFKPPYESNLYTIKNIKLNKHSFLIRNQKTEQKNFRDLVDLFFHEGTTSIKDKTQITQNLNRLMQLLDPEGHHQNAVSKSQIKKINLCFSTFRKDGKDFSSMEDVLRKALETQEQRSQKKFLRKITEGYNALSKNKQEVMPPQTKTFLSRKHKKIDDFYQNLDQLIANEDTKTISAIKHPNQILNELQVFGKTGT